MNPQFQIEPHDCSDDANAFEVMAQSQWRGEACSVGRGESFKGMETVRVVVFQNQNSPLRRAIEFMYFTGGWKVPNDKTTGLKDEAGAYKEAVYAAANGNSWARLLYLNQGLQLRRSGEEARFALVLCAQGWAQWRVLRRTQSGKIVTARTANFWWKPDYPLLENGAAFELWRTLRAQLDDPDSPIGFARRFAEIPNSPKALTWKFERGTQDEMETVLRHLFLAQTKWWQVPRHLGWWLDFKDRSAEIKPLDDLAKPRRTPTFNKSVERVWNWFSPTIDEEALTRHLELRRLYDTGDHFLRISAREPTMHEQLEAALLWREWLASTENK